MVENHVPVDWWSWNHCEMIMRIWRRNPRSDEEIGMISIDSTEKMWWTSAIGDRRIHRTMKELLTSENRFSFSATLHIKCNSQQGICRTRTRAVVRTMYLLRTSSYTRIYIRTLDMDMVLVMVGACSIKQYKRLDESMRLFHFIIISCFIRTVSKRKVKCSSLSVNSQRLEWCSIYRHGIDCGTYFCGVMSTNDLLPPSPCHLIN